MSTTTQTGIIVKLTQGLPFLPSKSATGLPLSASVKMTQCFHFVRVILLPAPRGQFYNPWFILAVLMSVANRVVPVGAIPLAVPCVLRFLVTLIATALYFFYAFFIFLVPLALIIWVILCKLASVFLSMLLVIFIPRLFAISQVVFIFIFPFLYLGLALGRSPVSFYTLQDNLFVFLIPYLLTGLAMQLQSIFCGFVRAKFIAWFPFLTLGTLFEVIHLTYQNKERPWLLLPVLSRTKQRQRRSNSMIAKYYFSGNFLVRDKGYYTRFGVILQ